MKEQQHVERRVRLVKTGSLIRLMYLQRKIRLELVCLVRQFSEIYHTCEDEDTLGQLVGLHEQFLLYFTIIDKLWPGSGRFQTIGELAKYERLYEDPIGYILLFQNDKLLDLLRVKSNGRSIDYLYIKFAYIQDSAEDISRYLQQNIKHILKVAQLPDEKTRGLLRQMMTAIAEKHQGLLDMDIMYVIFNIGQQLPSIRREDVTNYVINQFNNVFADPEECILFKISLLLRFNLAAGDTGMTQLFEMIQQNLDVLNYYMELHMSEKEVLETVCAFVEYTQSLSNSSPGNPNIVLLYAITSNFLYLNTLHAVGLQQVVDFFTWFNASCLDSIEQDANNQLFYNIYHNELTERCQTTPKDGEISCSYKNVVYYQQIRDLGNLVQQGEYALIEYITEKYLLTLDEAYLRSLLQEAIDIIFAAILHFNHRPQGPVCRFSERLVALGATLVLEKRYMSKLDYIAHHNNAIHEYDVKTIARWKGLIQRVESGFC